MRGEGCGSVSVLKRGRVIKDLVTNYYWIAVMYMLTNSYHKKVL